MPRLRACSRGQLVAPFSLALASVATAARPLSKTFTQPRFSFKVRIAVAVAMMFSLWHVYVYTIYISVCVCICLCLVRVSAHYFVHLSVKCAATGVCYLPMPLPAAWRSRLLGAAPYWLLQNTKRTVEITLKYANLS